MTALKPWGGGVRTIIRLSNWMKAQSSTLSKHLIISTYKTSLTCTGTYTQQTHKISSCMFRHSMGAIIRVSSLWLKKCFRNSPFYVTMLKLDPYRDLEVSPLGRLLLSGEDRGTPSHSLHGALRNISATAVKHF